MWDTSNREACCRHQVVESMMESLYWMGMAQPAKGTILPAATQVDVRLRSLRLVGWWHDWVAGRTSMRHMEVIQRGLLQVSIVCKPTCLQLIQQRHGLLAGSIPAALHKRNKAQRCTPHGACYKRHKLTGNKRPLKACVLQGQCAYECVQPRRRLNSSSAQVPVGHSN